MDPAVMARLRAEVGPETLADLIDTMIRDTPRLFAGLESALAKADGEELSHWAHTLKSNAMMVGAEALVRQLQDIESLSNRGSMAEAGPRVARVLDDYRDLMGIVAQVAKGPVVG